MSPRYPLFKKALDDMSSNARPPRDTFDDFLLMAFVALQQTVHVFKTGEPCPELEQTTHVLKKYHKTPNDFGTAFAELTMCMEDDPYDYLGKYYGEIEATNSKSGQFFTPTALSQAMAQMSISEDTYLKALAEGKRFSVSDPAVGAGSCLIAVVPLLRKWEADPSTVFFSGVDVDLRCVRMCYIQLSLLGIPALVTHGNTLSLEEWGHYETLSLVMNPLPRGRRTSAFLESSSTNGSPHESSTTNHQQGDQDKSQPLRRLILPRARNA